MKTKDMLLGLSMVYHILLLFLFFVAFRNCITIERLEDEVKSNANHVDYRIDKQRDSLNENVKQESDHLKWLMEHDKKWDDESIQDIKKRVFYLENK